MSDLASQLQALIHDRCAAAVEIAVEATYEQLQQVVANDHYETGALFDSIYRGDVIESEIAFTAEVGATADQASMVDEGTAPHPIDPTGPWPMHWVDPVLGDTFRWHVEHPGYQGSGWFSNQTSEDAWAEELQIAFELLAASE